MCCGMRIEVRELHLESVLSFLQAGPGGSMSLDRQAWWQVPQLTYLSTPNSFFSLTFFNVCECLPV